jgi:hypothetical protein
MHNEKYIDALYRFHDMLADDFAQFVDETEQEGLDKDRIHYADCVMHLAKNLTKELLIEEGMSPEEIEAMSGSNQGYGRAIRTTPGPNGGTSQYNGQGGSSAYMPVSGRSMNGTARNGGRSSYAMGNNSGKRDAMGRFTRSGGEGQDVFSTMQKMADMTADHTEREMIMRLMERLKNETNQ